MGKLKNLGMQGCIYFNAEETSSVFKEGVHIFGSFHQIHTCSGQINLYQDAIEVQTVQISSDPHETCKLTHHHQGRSLGHFSAPATKARRHNKSAFQLLFPTSFVKFKFRSAWDVFVKLETKTLGHHDYESFLTFFVPRLKYRLSKLGKPGETCLKFEKPVTILSSRNKNVRRRRLVETPFNFRSAKNICLWGICFRHKFTDRKRHFQHISYPTVLTGGIGICPIHFNVYFLKDFWQKVHHDTWARGWEQPQWGVLSCVGPAFLGSIVAYMLKKLCLGDEFIFCPAKSKLMTGPSAGYLRAFWQPLFLQQLLVPVAAVFLFKVFIVYSLHPWPQKWSTGQVSKIVLK